MTLPEGVRLKEIRDVELVDEHGSSRGQAWRVWYQDACIGEVFLGRTKRRLMGARGKPFAPGWMINGQGTQTYRNRNYAAAALLKLHLSEDDDSKHDDNYDNKLDDNDCNYDDERRTRQQQAELPVTAALKLPPDVELRLEQRLADLEATDEQCERFFKLLAQWMSVGFNNEDRDTEDGKFLVSVVQPFSASQVKKYVECERKWGWQYLEGIKPDPKAAAELGKKVHAILERWLEGGEPPDTKRKEGKIAFAGLDHLPRPSEDLEVERGFLILYRGLFFLGFVDLGLESEDERVWVIDHKTTGDFMWALTEKQMPEDVQVVLYAKEAADRYDVDEVSLMWLYYRTRGKAKSEPRVTQIDRSEIESGMEIIHGVAAEMAEHRRKQTPVLQLAANAYACANFGGCDFQDRCNLTKKEKRRSIMARDTQKKTMAAKMAERRRQKDAEKNGEDATTTETEDETSNVRPLAPKKRRGVRRKKKTENKEEQAAANEAPEEKEEDSSEEGDKPPKKARGVRRARGRKKKEETEDQAKEETPQVNPPEKPSEEEAKQPLNAEEKQEEAESGGKKKKAKKSSSKKASGMDDRTAFVALYSEGIKAGDLEIAKKAWTAYKGEFGVG